MKYVSDKSMMPKGAHIGVIVFSTRWVEGDERSRTNPGHGYPGHNESIVQYIAFENDAEFSKWVERNAKEHFAVVSAVTRTIQTELIVKLV